MLFTQELAHSLDGSGVVVNAVHPGLVARTGLLQDIRGPFKLFTDTRRLRAAGSAPWPGVRISMRLLNSFPLTVAVSGQWRATALYLRPFPAGRRGEREAHPPSMTEIEAEAFSRTVKRGRQLGHPTAIAGRQVRGGSSIGLQSVRRYGFIVVE